MPEVPCELITNKSRDKGGRVTPGAPKAPRTKNQAPEKPQAPISNAAGSIPPALLGTWGLGACLGLGAWDLELWAARSDAPHRPLSFRSLTRPHRAVPLHGDPPG